MTEPKPEYDAQDKTIFRRAKDKDNPFVMIDRTIFSDEKTSWKAKGLLGYLLSKPDDWITRMGDLVKRTTDGQYATASAIRELEARGYLTRYQEKDEHGRFKQLVIEVHEIPVAPDKRTHSPKRQPQSGFPLADNPQTDDPQAGNQSITNTDCTDTDCTNTPGEDSRPDLFDLAIKTEQARRREGEWTTPHGGNGLVATAITCIYSELGSAPPEPGSGTWIKLCQMIEPVLADYRVRSETVIKQGVALFHKEQPTTFDPWYKSFPGQLGIYLGKANNGGQPKVLKVGY